MAAALPCLRFAGLILGLACGALFIRIWLMHVATPLERFYFPEYARLTLLPQLPARHLPLFKIVFANGAVTTEDLSGHIEVRTLPLNPDRFTAWLCVHIYGGKSLATVLRWPLSATAVGLVCFLILGARLDRRRNLTARNGQRSEDRL